jgi:YidC/Oxa1 family membrane protein insertase
MEPTQSSNSSPRNPDKKELSMEMRLLLAFVLMGVVLFVTPYFYKPGSNPTKGAKSAQPTPASTQQAKTAEVKPPPKPSEPAPKTPVAPVSAGKEETFVVDTDLYKITFSNRGAVIHSWILKRYLDAAGHPIDLVNAAAAEKVGYPLSLMFEKTQPATDPNLALYAAKPAPDSLGVDYEFSDGKLFVRKSLRFGKSSYLSHIETEVKEGGAEIPHLVVWRGGFGDSSVLNAVAVQRTIYYDLSENKLVQRDPKAAKDGPVVASGNFSFAGLEDTYFAAVVLPTSNSHFEIRTLSDKLTPPGGSKEELRIGAALGGDSPNHFDMFVGPKDLDILRAVNPKLEQVVDWGFFGILAKPLFLSLNWVNDHIAHNFGWAIVIVTIAINLLLSPLSFANLKSMRKMQTLQPQIAAINAKYKDIGMRDPRKAQQNQEVMDLYKKHGVNPLGGCMPMLLQIPFFIAYYKVLSVAIELRGASWLWVHDLSQPETIAIRILPIAMIATQFLMQKMTPQTSADPSQQRVMMFMPLMLGFMFYSVSSGLVLYWLTGNVVGIARQWLFNRLMAAPLPPTQPKETKAQPKKRR